MISIVWTFVVSWNCVNITGLICMGFAAFCEKFIVSWNCVDITGFIHFVMLIIVRKIYNVMELCRHYWFNLYGDVQHCLKPSWLHAVVLTTWCGFLHSLDISCNHVFSFLAATKQLYEWFSQSVCLSVRLSVRPSVCHTFLTMFPSSYHHEIFRSYYQWQKWRPCKRSRSEVKGQGHRGHNPT